MSELQTFCRTILKILETKDHPIWFSPMFGLCHNAFKHDQEFNTKIYSTLFLIFKGDMAPFNQNSLNNYAKESWNGGIYKNEKRLAFLREHS